MQVIKNLLLKQKWAESVTKDYTMEGRRFLLEIFEIILNRRCKSFSSSDRTGVGGWDADLSL